MMTASRQFRSSRLQQIYRRSHKYPRRGLAYFRLVFLTLIRSSIAAARVLSIGTRHATLIGLQYMTAAVFAAIRVTRINRRASREYSHGLGGSAVVLQGTQVGVGVVQIAHALEPAAKVAAQVVANRGDGTVTISSRTVRDNTVLEHHCAALDVKDAATPAIARGIPAERAVVDHECSIGLE